MQGKVFSRRGRASQEKALHSLPGEQEAFSLTPPSLGLGVSSPGGRKAPISQVPPPPPSPQDSSSVFPDLNLGDLGALGELRPARGGGKPVHCAGRAGPPLCCLCKRLSIIALPVTPASCYLSLRLTSRTRHYIGSCWGCRTSLLIHAAGRCRLG